MVDAVTSTAATTAQANIGSTRTKLATNFQTFLSLLTTQLKNQDPTAPLDTNQFTQQLTEMTGVEQQLLTNELLSTLVAKAGATDSSGGGLSSAVSLIGKTATANSDTAPLGEKGAVWGYTLPKAAASSTVTISNAAGQVVWTGALPDLKAGQHDFSWDGKTSSGAQAPVGDYKIKVAAADSAGADIVGTTSVTGLVRAVEQADGATFVTVAGLRLPLTAITAVRQTDS